MILTYSCVYCISCIIYPRHKFKAIIECMFELFNNQYKFVNTS